MRYLACILSALVIGCGGGGGSGEQQFAGVYRVRLVAVENNCSYSVEPETRTYTVNHVGSTVVVDSSNGPVYEGITTGDGRFVASNVGVGNCVNSAGNTTSSTYQYTLSIEFVFDDPDSPQVVFTSDSGNCSRNTVFDSTCRYSMRGIASREA